MAEGSYVGGKSDRRKGFGDRECPNPCGGCYSNSVVIVRCAPQSLA